MKKSQFRKEKKPKNQVVKLLGEGTQALHRGQLAKAVRLLERARRLDQENADVALNLGGAYILSKKFTQAVAVLEPLSERDARNPMVWTNLAAAYLGNPVLATDEGQQRAIAAFKRAIGLNPAAPNVAYNLGLIYHDRQEIDKALHWFNCAVRANPNDQDAKYYIKKLAAEAKNDSTG